MSAGPRDVHHGGSTVIEVPAWVGADWSIAFPWALATVVTALLVLLVVDVVSIAASALEGQGIIERLRTPVARLAATFGGARDVGPDATTLTVLVLAVLAGRRAVLSALARMPFSWSRLGSLCLRVGLIAVALTLVGYRFVAAGHRLAPGLAEGSAGGTAWLRGLLLGTVVVALLVAAVTVVHLEGQGPTARLGLPAEALRAVRRRTLGTIVAAAAVVGVLGALEAVDDAAGEAAMVGALRTVGAVLANAVDVGAVVLVDALPPLGAAAVLTERGGLLGIATPWWLRLVGMVVGLVLVVHATRRIVPADRWPPGPRAVWSAVVAGMLGLGIGLLAVPALLAAGVSPVRVLAATVVAAAAGAVTDVFRAVRQQRVRFQVRD